MEWYTFVSDLLKPVLLHDREACDAQGPQYSV